MKKLIAFVLCILLICISTVTAFAASPTASTKVSVTLRKADGSSNVEKVDVAYTLDGGATVSVEANEADYGTFNSWSIYKVVSADAKPVPAVAGVDYKIIKGSLNDAEMSIEVYTDIIICGNYGGVVTDPLELSTPSDKSDTSPETGDITVVYAALVLAAAAVIFGAKKQYSK